MAPRSAGVGVASFAWGCELLMRGIEPQNVRKWGSLCLALLVLSAIAAVRFRLR